MVGWECPTKPREASGLDPEAVHHAGHHGSSTSSTEPFMQAVDPEFGIISSAFDSQFGHPHDVVLDRFDEMGLTTYWTGVHGDILVTTDGETIDVSPAAEESTDPAVLSGLRPDDTAMGSATPQVGAATLTPVSTPVTG